MFFFEINCEQLRSFFFFRGCHFFCIGQVKLFYIGNNLFFCNILESDSIKCFLFDYLDSLNWNFIFSLLIDERKSNLLPIENNMHKQHPKPEVVGSLSFRHNLKCDIRVFPGFN